MSNADSVLVEAQNLSLFYGSRCIVEDLSFKILQGTLTAVVGPNGAGKSTLLKALVGLHPFRGKLQFSHSCRRGYLPQVTLQDFQFPLRVDEFVAFGLWKQKAENKKQSINEALEKMQALDLKKKNLDELSRGQFQRVTLARTLVHNPHCLFLDEPMTGLDEPTSHLIFEFLAQFKSQGGTAMVVLHDEKRRQELQMTEMNLNFFQPKGNEK